MAYARSGMSFALCSYSSYQFNDYSKYDVMKGTQERRAKYWEEQFPIDLQNAYDLGKRLVEKAKESYHDA